ncbi:preprotein translocase subunit SecE [Candidatus Igneacidithiobacillus taiwanensis]|uniref:preprotein translocase subunit SecE n=1 Tax=Candidatus Igneacidithiobacillus taiwanensis TaxID=1945924 RepID=UPI00289F5A97|nr:preprotein translocase subunit SecE [Candidatus Igneacidithiobacillus taiwanensis]
MSEKVKLYVAAFFAALGVIAYFLVPLRFGGFMPSIALIIALLLALALFATTLSARALLLFFRESYVEIRKVVWPTRPELLRSTAVILGLIIVIASFLWLVDLALLAVVRFALGGA